MKSAIAFAIAAALAASASPVLAGQHEHGAVPAKATTESPAKRFATDATLRQEMKGIRASVDALAHYEHGHMGPEQAVALASAIEGHVNTIIANCKLPPDADAALHTIIVPLQQHALALEQKPEDLSAIPPMRDAIASYDRQFTPE